MSKPPNLVISSILLTAADAHVFKRWFSAIWQVRSGELGTRIALSLLIVGLAASPAVLWLFARGARCLMVREHRASFPSNATLGLAAAEGGRDV